MFHAEFSRALIVHAGDDTLGVAGGSSRRGRSSTESSRWSTALKALRRAGLAAGREPRHRAVTAMVLAALHTGLSK